MKKYVSILTVLVLIFTINVNVFATTTPVTDTLKGIGLIVEDFKQANQYTWTQISDFIDTMSQVVGLPKKGHSSGGHSFDPHIIDNIDPDVDTDDPDSVGTWISNQISIQDNDDITVTNDFRTMFNDFNDSLSPAYLYSFTLDEYASARNISTALYLKLKDRISQASDLFTTVYFLKNTGNSVQIFSLDLHSYPYIYARYGSSVSGIYASLQLVNGYDNTNISLTGNGWNSTDQDFNTDVTDNGKVQGLLENSSISISPTGTWGNGSTCFVSNHTRKAIRLFNGTATASDLIYQPYYYNNDVWKDFSSSYGDYTFDASNINTVSYGDIVSYIDSFNTENGYPPTVQEIEVNIKNEDTNNKDESGGDDSGGGSGSDDDDNGSIFDWLKNLGKVLGDLIKGIGEFITEIIAGLVSALNDLMSSLSGLITDTLGSLTTVFSSIIDFVYAGLPDSVKGIMMLALTVSLLITVIQLIRK